ncbi:predicted protein [Nematostella vectensis]|uniref:sulfite oxidase n=1 Tax=Nematostella vectensis TaxID=45351 RepID=A7RTU7_NEMVE|nr:predicted protein [Nematostella vectensis]|eukprot:XP_001637155.1 predicted protein [Nematostella vectensis]
MIFPPEKEVSKHNNRKSRIWVTYKGGVYDITDFIDGHPGGTSKIILAAGAALEPYWAMYAVHKKEEVLEILEEYRIGDLAHEDQVIEFKEDDPFKEDPERHPALKKNSEKPFNAEPPLQLLGDSYITPNELFFVRNHLPVPVIDPKLYRIEVTGEGVRTIKLSLEELKTKFKKHNIVSTIQCAGNRRSDMNRVKKVKGLDWSEGAISTAEWGGALLKDVLKYAGLSEDDVERLEINHVQFEGLDTDITGATYGASIPIQKAISSRGDVILAYEMNGKDIPRDHGYPVRAVAPGIVGARNVKWVSKVISSKEESPSHWQQNDYKGFAPCTDWDTVDFKSSPAIQDLPVTSAICQPLPGTLISRDEEEITLSGYAWSGGGRRVVRVDVSLDGGKNWSIATLDGKDQPPGRAWAWSLWSTTLPIPPDANKLDVVCKAVDESFNVQPDSVAPIWNLRGVLSNAWHRVSVSVVEDVD